MIRYQKVPGGYLVEDNTSIYEIDLECYQCLTEDEKKLVTTSGIAAYDEIVIEQ